MFMKPPRASYHKLARKRGNTESRGLKRKDAGHLVISETTGARTAFKIWTEARGQPLRANLVRLRAPEQDQSGERRGEQN